MATDRERSYGKSYNDAGYIEINPNSYQWFNENLGTNFGSAEDYYKWIYGGGNLVSGADLLGQGYDQSVSVVRRMATPARILVL